MTRLSVRDVFAAYGGTEVLSGVTLPDCPGGVFMGLLGPNASGKSTLLRRISREMSGRGQISFDGADQQLIGRKDWMRLVAVMPQTPPAPTALTATELMWSTARALDIPLSDRQLAGRIEEVLGGLGLAAFSLAPLYSLSGGKRQLVGLALALIRNPDFLLLDEPTSALDLHWRMSVLERVRKRVKAVNGVAIAALHDLDLAAGYCDTLVLLDAGRVVAAGHPVDVLTPENLARVYHVEATVSMRADGRLKVDVLKPITGTPENV